MVLKNTYNFHLNSKIRILMLGNFKDIQAISAIFSEANFSPFPTLQPSISPWPQSISESEISVILFQKSGKGKPLRSQSNLNGEHITRHCNYGFLLMLEENLSQIWKTSQLSTGPITTLTPVFQAHFGKCSLTVFSSSPSIFSDTKMHRSWP